MTAATEQGAVLEMRSAFNPLTLWASLLFAVILGFSRLSYGMLLPGIQRAIGEATASWGRWAPSTSSGIWPEP